MPNEPSNIFDAAAQASKKKKEAAAHPAVTPPVPDEFNKEKITPDDVDKMFEQISKMGEDLQTKTENVYVSTGVSPKDLHQFLSKIGGKEWENMQKDRKKLEEQIWSVSSIEAERKHTKIEEDQASKTRRGKTIGSRKSWISMR